MRRRLMTSGPRAVLLPLLFASTLTAVGQSSPSPLFHTGTRIVLTDVTVLDGAGQPVRGLKQSDFTILDDGNRQKIKSFEAHADRAQPILADAPQKPGTPIVTQGTGMQCSPSLISSGCSYAAARRLRLGHRIGITSPALLLTLPSPHYCGNLARRRNQLSPNRKGLIRVGRCVAEQATFSL